MKILLFFPQGYSLDKTIKSSFESIGHEAEVVDFMSFFSTHQRKKNNLLSKLPRKLYSAYFQKYIGRVNKRYLTEVEIKQPDLIFLYNDQLLLSDTIKKIQNICPVINFLGDNPYYYYHNDRPFVLDTMLACDYIFSPDSFWIEQFKILGVENISPIVFSHNPSLSNYSDVPNRFKEENTTDVLFIGSTYPNSWGYKRTFFINHFKDFDLKIYGRSWKRWLAFFPELESKYTEIDGRLSFEQLNWMVRCAKICPIDANPGLLNGMHIRVLDTIASNSLPIVEYRKDIAVAFKETRLPIMKNYNEGKKIAEYFLKNEEERLEVLSELKSFIDDKFSPSEMANYIISELKINNMVKDSKE